MKTLKLNFYKNKLKKLTNEKDILLCKANILKYSPFFNKKYYTHVYSIKGDPFIHYLEEGYKKGYNPSPDFNTNIYFDMYPDVKEANINPLLHYELYGKNEQRQPGALAIDQGIYYPKKITRFVLRHIARLLNFNKIRKNKHSKSLVVLHLFYMKSIDEIIEYLKNLECYNYDLIVTYIEGMYHKEALDKIKKFKPNTKLKKYNNKGFDVGPFIDVINNINLKKYDIIIKLQTKSTAKSTYSYKMFFKNRDWFLNLFNGVLGSFSIHKTIDKLYNDTKYGIVAAKNLIIEDPKHKQNLVKEKSPIKPKKYNYKFIAGSCFAIRAKCLKEIQKENISIKHFDEVKRGVFTFGHVMERTICFIIENQNYKFYGNKVDFIRHLKYNKAEQNLKSLSTLNLYNIKDLKIEENIAINYIEPGFEKNHEIIYTKLKNVKGNKITKFINNKKTNNNISLIINQNNEILNNANTIKALKENENDDTIIKILKINFITINLNNIKPFSNNIIQK